MTQAWLYGLAIGDQVVLSDAIWRVDGFEGTDVRLVGIGSGEVISRSIHDLVWDSTFSPFVNGGTDEISDVLAAADVMRIPPAAMSRAVVLARHLEEVERGFAVLPDEVTKQGAKPRAAYRPDRSVAEKFAAKLSELRDTEFACSERQLYRHMANYRKYGVLGLVPERDLGKQVRARRVDSRFVDVLASQALAEVDGPERGTNTILMATRMVIEGNEEYADVEIPSVSTQKRLLQEVSLHENLRRGRRKYVQSANDRPDRTHQVVAPVMPGERLELDSTVLNVLVRDPWSGRSYRPYLSVAMDVATRCVVGMVVSSFVDHSTVQCLMLDAMTPKPAVPMRQVESYVNRLGVAPEVLEEVYPGLSLADGDVPEGPLVRPRTVVIDQGKPYYNLQVRSMLARIGTALEMARPATPTDKPHVERFFRTLEEVLVTLKGYVGKDNASGGKRGRVDADALLMEAELETVLRAWVAMVYHHRRHSGLRVPVSRGQTMSASPMEMFTLLVQEHGFMPAPLNPELRYLMMSVERLTIQNDGIHLNGLTYDGPDLDHVRGVKCPWARDGLWLIHFDPMDCRRVYLLVPYNGSRVWVEVPWKHRPPVMRHPFPFRVLKFARSYEPALGSSGGTVAWKPRSNRRGRSDSSAAAADASIEFLHWVATEIGTQRASGEDPSAVEMRAIRAWASSLHGTPMERLEERFLTSHAEDLQDAAGANADAADALEVADSPDRSDSPAPMEVSMRDAWQAFASDDDSVDGVGA